MLRKLDREVSQMTVIDARPRSYRGADSRKVRSIARGVSCWKTGSVGGICEGRM